MHWRAENFFDDPNVIELCRAIETNDLAQMKQLIDAGVDVNAKGKDNMTPLLWAFPDNKLERFKILMEAGADPNVYIKSNLGVSRAFRAGDSVTHMAARTYFPYFDVVFENGGDPNLPSKTMPLRAETPIFTVITAGGPKAKERIKALIAMGANINHRNNSGDTPLRLAAGFGGQYDLCLFLIDSGADPSIYYSNGTQKLTHVLAKADGLLSIANPEQRAAYDRLVKRLYDEYGESVDEARQDLERYGSYSGENKRKRQQIELRLTRIVDAFKTRNHVRLHNGEKYERIKEEVQKRGNKNLDEYTLYKWVELEFLDGNGDVVEVVDHGRGPNVTTFHVDLVAVKWDDEAIANDALFIDLKEATEKTDWKVAEGMEMVQFRVCGTDRVSFSGSIAGFKNQKPLKQGTILKNSSWLTILTNSDGTQIDELEMSANSR